MTNSTEGVRRLSLFVGGISMLLWHGRGASLLHYCWEWLASFWFGLTGQPDDRWPEFNSWIDSWEWFEDIGGFVVIFFAGLVFVRLVAWTIRGWWAPRTHRPKVPKPSAHTPMVMGADRILRELDQRKENEK